MRYDAVTGSKNPCCRFLFDLIKTLFYSENILDFNLKKFLKRECGKDIISLKQRKGMVRWMRK